MKNKPRCGRIDDDTFVVRTEVNKVSNCKYASIKTKEYTFCNRTKSSRKNGKSCPCNYYEEKLHWYALPKSWFKPNT